MQMARIGPGEVGGVGATDLRPTPRGRQWGSPRVDPDGVAGRQVLALGLRASPSADEAVQDAGGVISAEAAVHVLAFTAELRGGLGEDTWYLDLDSAAQGRDQLVTADVVEIVRAQQDNVAVKQRA